MREIRTSGSEGGGGRKGLSLPLSVRSRAGAGWPSSRHTAPSSHRHGSSSRVTDPCARDAGVDAYKRAEAGNFILGERI